MILKNILNSDADFESDFSSEEFMTGVATKILCLHGFPIKRRICKLKIDRHAVFRCGGLVVKIFPNDTEVLGMSDEYCDELFAYRLEEMKYISAPRMIAKGELFAKYLFRYFIYEYIPGETLRGLRISVSGDVKRNFSRQIFDITSHINRPVCDFGGKSGDRLMADALDSRNFIDMPIRFQEERLALIGSFKPNCFLFTHGNLTRDNMLVTHGNKLYVIGFSQVLKAPIEYETAGIVFDLFEFDRYYLRGYYGLYDSFELAEKCLVGVLIHKNGREMLNRAFGDIYNINSVNELRDMIFRRVKLR